MHDEKCMKIGIVNPAWVLLEVGLVVGMTGGPVYLSKTIGLLAERENDLIHRGKLINYQI